MEALAGRRKTSRDRIRGADSVSSSDGALRAIVITLCAGLIRAAIAPGQATASDQPDSGEEAAP